MYCTLRDSWMRFRVQQDVCASGLQWDACSCNWNTYPEFPLTLLYCKYTSMYTCPWVTVTVNHITVAWQLQIVITQVTGLEITIHKCTLCCLFFHRHHSTTVSLFFITQLSGLWQVELAVCYLVSRAISYREAIYTKQYTASYPCLPIREAC